MPVNTVSGPALFEFHNIDGSGTPVIITNEQQLEDAKFTSNVLKFDHKTQASAAPHVRVQTGAEASLMISVADVTNTDLLALCLGATVSGTGANKTVAIGDFAGRRFLQKKVILKPYVGVSVTTNQTQWVVIPNGEVTAETVDFSYGLQTQQSFMINVYPVADANGFKFYRGNGQPFGVTIPAVVVSYNTTAAGGSSPTAAQGVLLTSSSASDTIAFNFITPRTGSANSMEITIGGTVRGTVTFPSDYAGQTFRFYLNSTTLSYNGTFTNGPVTLTAS